MSERGGADESICLHAGGVSGGDRRTDELPPLRAVMIHVYDTREASETVSEAGVCEPFRCVPMEFGTHPGRAAGAFLAPGRGGRGTSYV